MVRLLAASLAWVVVAAGCTTDVAPAVPGDEVFTLWGQLDPTADLQALHVAQIRATIDQPVDFSTVSVVSVDLGTGVETQWRDSLLTLTADGPVHVFVADYRPDYGRPVEVQIRRDGIVETSARVTVPPFSDPAFAPLQYVARDYVDLVAPSAPTLVGAFVDYTVYVPQHSEDVFVQRFRVRDDLILPVDGGTVARVDLTDHIAFILLTLELRYPDDYEFGAFTFSVCDIRMDLAVANSGWAPPTPLSFSPVLLMQPGTVSNVERGYGFLGAAYAMERVWAATPLDLQRLNLTPGRSEICDAVDS